MIVFVCFVVGCDRGCWRLKGQVRFRCGVGWIDFRNLSQWGSRHGPTPARSPVDKVARGGERGGFFFLDDETRAPVSVRQ